MSINIIPDTVYETLPFVGVLTGARDPLHPPTEMTEDLKGLLQHPALNQMLKYSFVGSKQTVKKQVQAFLETTGVNELIMVSTMYDINDRIKSARLFAEIMAEINSQGLTDTPQD